MVFIFTRFISLKTVHSDDITSQVEFDWIFSLNYTFGYRFGSTVGSFLYCYSSLYSFNHIMDRLHCNVSRNSIWLFHKPFVSPFRINPVAMFVNSLRSVFVFAIVPKCGLQCDAGVINRGLGVSYWLWWVNVRDRRWKKSWEDSGNNVKCVNFGEDKGGGRQSFGKRKYLNFSWFF